MFVYCGDSDNGKIRVLDTSDMVTEEVDKIQLKAIQSQGYKIVKDFSYDYAYKLHTYLKQYSHPCTLSFGFLIRNSVLKNVLEVLHNLCNGFVDIISVDKMKDSYSHFISYHEDVCIYCFLYWDDIVIITSSKCGVFTNTVKNEKHMRDIRHIVYEDDIFIIELFEKADNSWYILHADSMCKVW